MVSPPQVLYLSHGGGPLPLLSDPDHQPLVKHLQQLRERLRLPQAIIVFSAHWEAEQVQVTGACAPGLVYDYHGFPAQAYDIAYPAPGAPWLAELVQQTLQQAGIASTPNSSRGFDHGVFVPLKIMFPEAQVPVIQVSLLSHLDAHVHLQLGAALANLPVDDLLVVGSGFSFHNMQAFFKKVRQADHHNLAFESWLQQTLCSHQLNESERWRRLAQWHQAPSARFCHPREEHLLPLHICYGLTQRPCDEHHTVPVLGKQASFFYWQ